MNKAINKLFSFGGLVLTGALVYRFVDRTLNKKEISINKYKKYYNVINQWLYNKNLGINLSEYFVKKGYNNIAIYGMGELGNRLYEELKDSPIKISYGIDKEANSKYSEVKVIEVNEHFDDVDVIVITPIFDYDSIKALLGEKTDIKIISLEDVIFDFV